MAFNSFTFWLIYPLLFAFYWIIPSSQKTAKKWYLILVSYLLYMNWKPAFAIVLLGVTLITYFGALIIQKDKERNRKKLIYIFSILGLLPLLIFKYYNFLNESLIAGLESIGLHFSLPGLNWAVPVGISFFTFQAVGYLFDVYYKKIEAETSLSDYTLFVSFFPQVTSGPISKASELLPQIKNPKPFNYPQAVAGLKLLLWGMFMKLVIADRLGLYVDFLYANYTHYTGLNCFIASVFYSIQIYTDFAGYSLMAMGIAKTLGFDIINNFQRPYFSISVTDFWHRWHISLSRWLKDYVYIPMGGSRCSKLRNYWNIFVTFLVSGIWHGANWTFIAWGVMHGVCQIIEKALGFQKYDGHSSMIRISRICITFLIVNFAWIFFRMPTFEEATGIIGHMFTHFSKGTVLHDQQMSIMAGLPFLLFKDFRDEFFRNKMQFLDTAVVRRSIYLFIFFMIIMIGVLDSGQFIYGSF